MQMNPLLFKINVAKAIKTLIVIKVESLEVAGTGIAWLMVGQVIVVTARLRRNLLLLPFSNGI